MKPSYLSRGFLAASLTSLTWADSPSNPPQNCSETVVVIFPVVLTQGRGAPDGFERDMIFINGQFPGPTLEIEEGDNVEFVVYNKLPYKTTVHFHGIEQYHTPWSDGVPGLTQAAISPNESFVYKWKAAQYGTYWYHSHYKGQLADGLFGAIHIKPAKGTPNLLNRISNATQSLRQLEDALDNPEPVLLSDWSHFTSEQIYDVNVNANIGETCGDSLLINGKGSVNCPGVPFLMSLVSPVLSQLLNGQILTDKGCLPVTSPLEQTSQPKNLQHVPPGLFEGCNATNSELAVIEADPRKGWISLNFISTASLQHVIVSIDDHPMWLYAVDGRYIEPQLLDAMTFLHGSRYAVMVQLNKPARDYTIRLASSGFNQKIYTSATLSYTNGSGKNIPNASINYSGANTTADVRYLDDTSFVPFPPVYPAQTADQTIKLHLNQTGKAYQWSLNSTRRYDLSFEDITPLIYNPTGLENTGIAVATKNNTWVDLIVMMSSAEGPQPPHPIHKHSNKVHVIGHGVGEFNYTDVAEAMQFIPQNFNLDNPPYRDGFYTIPVAPDSSWVAVRYKSENPGPYLLHCHIKSHFGGGMGIAILDGYGDWPEVPADYEPGAKGGRVTQLLS